MSYMTDARGIRLDSVNVLSDVEIAAVIASRLNIPSYSPVNLTPFMAAYSAYNFKPSNTRKIRAALGRASTGGICEIACIGDSLTAGANSSSTYSRLNSWPMKMRDELVRHGVTDGGTGLVRNLDGAAFDSRWTYTGTWNGSFLTFTYIAAAGTATFTTDKAGNRVTVGYYDAANGTDQFTVSVNGASSGAGFTTVTASGPAGWKQVTLSASIAVGQTVVITRTAGTVYLRGTSVWNSTGGLLVHNLGQSGSRASGTGTDRWADASAIDRLGQVYAAPTSSLSVPDLVIIALGFNDKVATASDSTITSAITTIRNRYSTSDAMLVLTHTGVAPSDPTWSTFGGAMYSLANTLNVPLVDFYHRLGGWSTIQANGLNGDATVHLVSAAYADEGRSLGMLLST